MFPYFFSIRDIYDFQHRIVNLRFLKDVLSSLKKTQFSNLFDEIILDLYRHDLFDFILRSKIDVVYVFSDRIFLKFCNDEILEIWTDGKITNDNRFFNSNINQKILNESIKKIIESENWNILKNSFLELFEKMMESFHSYENH